MYVYIYTYTDMYTYIHAFIHPYSSTSLSHGHVHFGDEQNHGSASKGSWSEWAESSDVVPVECFTEDPISFAEKTPPLWCGHNMGVSIP